MGGGAKLRGIKEERRQETEGDEEGKAGDEAKLKKEETRFSGSTT